MEMEARLPSITKAKLILTNLCQLRCKYCYETHGHESMSLESAKSIIDFIYKNARESNKVPEISFFGGEPLLVYNELVKPCIEYIRNNLKSRFPITMTTNGLLLDEDILKYLRSMNVSFMLSIDGCRESHDTNRVKDDGQGSFDDLEKNIPAILKYFPNTRAYMTITPNTVEYLYKSVRDIAEKGFLDMHIIPDFSVLSSGGWTPEVFEIAEEQMLLIKDYIIDAFEDSDIPLVFKSLEDMFPRIVLSSYSESAGHYRVAKVCRPECRCGIGVLDNVIIDVYGNIFSCQHGSNIPEESNPLYLGNMTTGVIEERRMALLNMNLEPLHSTTLDCKECPLNYICTGGCVPDNYAVTGSFTEVPEHYCRWTRILYNTAVDIIEYFDGRKNNTLFKDYFYGVVKRGVRCVC